MHRVDAPGHMNGAFFDGNPAAGQQATQLLSAWFNDVQENICYVIEEQGILLIKGDATQLSAAIVALVEGAVGTGEGEVPTTRQVLGGGLVTGGGTLALDRTLTVTKATPAEVAAGIRDDVAITPLGLLGGVGARLLEATGYATLQGGVIEQWGTATVSANGSTNITLPITFPNQCVWAGFNGGNPSTDAQDNNPFVSNKSASALTVFNSENGPIAGQFRAIGF